MWRRRRMRRNPWTKRRTTVFVLHQVKIKTRLSSVGLQVIMQSFVHIARRHWGHLDRLIIWENIEGRRNRGRSPNRAASSRWFLWRPSERSWRRKQNVEAWWTRSLMTRVRCGRSTQSLAVFQTYALWNTIHVEMDSNPRRAELEARALTITPLELTLGYVPWEMFQTNYNRAPNAIVLRQSAVTDYANAAMVFWREQYFAVRATTFRRSSMDS